MSIRPSFLGRIAAAILWALPKRHGKLTGQDHARLDFPMSTQKMGVRFTDKIRDVFRFKWIKRH